MKRFFVSGECFRRRSEPDEACKWTFLHQTPPRRGLAALKIKRKWLRGDRGQKKVKHNKENALLVQFLNGRGRM